MIRSMRKNVRGEFVLAVAFLSLALIVLLDACSIDTAVQDPDQPRQSSQAEQSRQPEQASQPEQVSRNEKASQPEQPGEPVAKSKPDRERPARQTNQPSRQTNQPGGAKVAVGAFPPDFELPYLTFDKSADGKPVGVISGENTFKLSDHRGKKPVCMIMSSYT